jgi:hypothetical protein
VHRPEETIDNVAEECHDAGGRDVSAGYLFAWLDERRQLRVELQERAVGFVSSHATDSSTHRPHALLRRAPISDIMSTLT